ncbi:hypothetical protein JCM6882_009411 [Rhodosporidiobolus microsporus]
MFQTFNRLISLLLTCPRPGPVEICSGVTGLVYSIFLGKRRGWGTHIFSFKPHNVSFIIHGTIFLWVGWLGFNGGSTFAANVKAAVAITNTNLGAGFGGLTWMLMDWRLERKWSAVGYCTGVICGLVAIYERVSLTAQTPTIPDWLNGPPLQRWSEKRTDAHMPPKNSPQQDREQQGLDKAAIHWCVTVVVFGNEKAEAARGDLARKWHYKPDEPFSYLKSGIVVLHFPPTRLTARQWPEVVPASLYPEVTKALRQAERDLPVKGPQSHLWTRAFEDCFRLLTEEQWLSLEVACSEARCLFRLYNITLPHDHLRQPNPTQEQKNLSKRQPGGTTLGGCWSAQSQMLLAPLRLLSPELASRLKSERQNGVEGEGRAQAQELLKSLEENEWAVLASDAWFDYLASHELGRRYKIRGGDSVRQEWRSVQERYNTRRSECLALLELCSTADENDKGKKPTADAEVHSVRSGFSTAQASGSSGPPSLFSRFKERFTSSSSTTLAPPPTPPLTV